MRQTRRQLAYDAFRTSALKTASKSEGKLQYNTENMRRLTSSSL